MTDAPESITEKFERVFTYLTRASTALGKINDAPDGAKVHIEGAAALIEDVDKLVGQLRTGLRGCWTDEAREIREAPMRIRATFAEARSRAMHKAIDSALPALRDIRAELTDRPVLKALVEQVTEDLDESRRGERAGSPMVWFSGIGMLAALLGDQDDEGGEEIGDRAALVREASNLLHGDADVSPALTARLDALADELDNAPA